MAFFGLTQLGYQDTIREHVRDPKETPISAFRSGAYRDPNFRLPPLQEPCEISADEARENRFTGSGQTAAFGRGTCNSNAELNRFKYKHIRNPKENAEVYRKPVTTSAEIGHWRKDEPIVEREPWTYTKRHVRLDSEMTRFVSEMTLTNADFSLF